MAARRYEISFRVKYKTLMFLSNTYRRFLQLSVQNLNSAQVCIYILLYINIASFDSVLLLFVQRYPSFYSVDNSVANFLNPCLSPFTGKNSVILKVRQLKLKFCSYYHSYAVNINRAFQSQ